MRLIGTLDNERQAQVFSLFLSRKEIPHQIEKQVNTDWGASQYGVSTFYIWIQEEDQTASASQWFQLFKEQPQDPVFQPTQQTPFTALSPPEPPLAPQERPSSPWDQQAIGWITRALFIGCCLIFIFSHLWQPDIALPERYSRLLLASSPIDRALLYDYPQFYEWINQFIRLYGYDTLEHPEELSPDQAALLRKIEKNPPWPGFYYLILKKNFVGALQSFKDYPTFERIRQGELWRLFSPCLLHADIFHLFFNMIWLIILGKQMEQRLLPWRYVIFILLTGVISNTIQYLVSGPNFIGFSGVLCAMLGFIWVRQKVAAWEGYQLDRLTFIFIFIFIIGMAALQIASFVLEKYLSVTLAPNIANTAHLSGGLLGLLLGRCHFFSWRPT
jgi:GlpG protein